MEVRLRVAVAVLAGGELAEIAGSDGAHCVEEVKHDAARWAAVNLDVKLNRQRPVRRDASRDDACIKGERER